MPGIPSERSQFSVATTAQTYRELFGKLETGQPFVFSRFGDGDFEIMSGLADSYHAPNPRLAKEIHELYDTVHPYNMVANALHQLEDGMTAGLFAPWDNPKYMVWKQQRRFWNAIALHFYAVFRPAQLRALFDLHRDMPKILVGPHTSDAIEAMIGRHTLVQVPPSNAYDAIEHWMPELEQRLRTTSVLPLVYTAAGIATRAAHLRLLKRSMPLQALDLGSLVDFADNRPTRTWIKLAPPSARRILLDQPQW